MPNFPRDNSSPLRQFERIETLASELDQAADPSAGSARELTRAVLDLHRACLSRILERLRAAGEPAQELITTLAADDLVSALLVLHNLHPAPLAERVGAALERLRSQGCDAELLEIRGEMVRLRFRKGCGLPVGAMQALIEQSLTQAVPDVATIEFEEEEGTRSEDRAGYFPLPVIGGAHS